MTTWTSNLPAFLKDDSEAQQFALKAAAYPLSNKVKQNLRGGYTSGDFVTGASVNAVTISGVVRDAQGFAIWVGTNLLYNLFWELGHHNLFTGRYERVEKWRPAFMDSREEVRAAYSREYQRRMSRWKA